MSKEERQIIRRFAAGEVGLRDRAIQISRDYLPTDRKSPEQLFMREVDNPCPDLMLRAKYRQALSFRKGRGRKHEGFR